MADSHQFHENFQRTQAVRSSSNRVFGLVFSFFLPWLASGQLFSASFLGLTFKCNTFTSKCCT